MYPLSYGDLKDEHFTQIVPAYFFIITRQRNAWHGTESRQYRGQSSLTCTLQTAKSVAENWRAQGSTFSIQQVPGLHVMTEWTDIGLVEFHTNDSFAMWDSSDPSLIAPGKRITEVLDALGPNGPWRGVAPSPHSFVSGVLEAHDVVEPLGLRANFRAWSSYSHGGDYLLGWREETGRHKAPGVRRIARLAMNQSPVDHTETPSPEDEE